jgi:putative transposase
LKYAFIAEHQETWPVAVLGEVCGVGRSGFYAYQRRQAGPSLSCKETERLERIKAIAHKTDHRYGSRRMSKQLQEEGYEVGRCKVRRVMQQAGGSVDGCRRRAPQTTESRHG